ncbi:hypothetical protein GGI43DRAFT_283041 [Trichoderma evansii]
MLAAAAVGRRLDAPPRVTGPRFSPHTNAFRLGVCTTLPDIGTFLPAGLHKRGRAISYRACMASAESGCQRWADRIGQRQQHLVIADAGFSNYWAPFYVPFDISRCQDCLFVSSCSAVRLQPRCLRSPNSDRVKIDSRDGL